MRGRTAIYSTLARELNMPRSTHLVRLSLIWLALFGWPLHSWAQTPDPGFYHKLFPKDANLFRAMDVINGGPEENITQLAEAGNFSGQLWRFVPTGDGSFRLTTLFRGPGMCADIFNGGPNNNQVHLAPCADFSGQFWFVNATSDPPPFSNTFFARLTTKFRGTDVCLDHFQAGESFFPRLAPCGNTARQLWLVSRTDKRVE
jgi:hypothetical protein